MGYFVYKIILQIKDSRIKLFKGEYLPAVKRITETLNALKEAIEKIEAAA